MKSLTNAVTWLLVVTMLIGGSACTSTRTIRPSTQPGKPVYGAVKPGDRVTLQMADGRRLQIRVSHLDDEGVVSMEGVRYLRNDITHLERRSVSTGKTIALIAGITFGTLLVAGIMIVSALDDLWAY